MQEALNTKKGEKGEKKVQIVMFNIDHSVASRKTVIFANKIYRFVTAAY
jgi:hypothetical protein